MLEKIKKYIFPLSIFLIICSGAVVYINSLNGQFLWDDSAYIKDNIYIKDRSDILKIFSQNSGATISLESYAYRPLQEFSYMLDYSLWKLNVFGYHLTNALLHISVALSIYWLSRLLFNSRPLSLFTSILFVIYPGHTEAVSYISGRGDLLSALFMLLCFIFYIKQLHSGRKYSYICMLLSFVLAILSKENALILPILLLLYHYTFKQRIRIGLYLPVLMITVIYVFLRITMLGSLYRGFGLLIKRIPGFFVAITNYLRILLFPINLHMEYGNMLFRIVEPKALLGLAITILVLSYAFKIRNKDKLTFFSVCWFFIALLPTTGIYPVVAFYMAEHWLYLPSVGFFLILANSLILLQRIRKLRIFVLGLLLCVILFYSISTIKQNNYWKEPIAFYKRTLKYAPFSANIHNNLGAEYSAIGEKEKAIEEFQKAIGINPKMFIAYNNLGTQYLAIGEKEKAIEEFQKAIEINPKYTEGYENICEACVTIGKNEKAIEFCKRASELNPKAQVAYYNLGNAYYNIGKKTEAISAYQKAIAIEPHYFEAFNNLASLYADNGEIDKAINLWNKLIQFNPNFSTAHFNLAVFYYQQKKYDLAIKHCDKVIQLGNQVAPEFLKMLQQHRK